MNRKAAKAKIRNHLKKKGDDWCTTSEPQTLFWWRVLNDAIFNGKLTPPIRFELANFHEGVLGLCRPFGRSSRGDVVIGLRREYDTRSTFLTVLAHEMVHQNQWFTDKYMHHGKTFYDWERRVKAATGLPLSEYVDD